MSEERVMKEECIPLSEREKELKAQGFQKQFTCGEPRLSEMLDLYREMGKEVFLEPVTLAEYNRPECKNCFAGCSDDMKTIWTRNKINA